MANIYDKPNATHINLSLKNNTSSYLQTNLGNCELGIETDNDRIGFKDDGGNYFSLFRHGENLAGSYITGSVASALNANTVTNGVYTNGSYADPSWITSLAGSKITGTVANATNAGNADTLDNLHASAFQAAGVFNGLFSEYLPIYHDPGGFFNSRIRQTPGGEVIIEPSGIDGITFSGESSVVNKISANITANSELVLEANADVTIGSGNNIDILADDYVNIEANLQDVTITSDSSFTDINAGLKVRLNGTTGIDLTSSYINIDGNIVLFSQIVDNNTTPIVVTESCVRLTYIDSTTYTLSVSPTPTHGMCVRISNVSGTNHTVEGRTIPSGRFVDFMYDIYFGAWVMEY